jgi:hypothetical protein
LVKKALVKSLLISTLDKVIYYIGTFLEGSTKPLFTFNMRVLDLDFYALNPVECAIFLTLQLR